MNSLSHLVMNNMSWNFVKRGCVSNFALYRLKRQLYSPASLKLDTLEDNRNRNTSPNFSVSDFTEKMKRISAPENTEIIFSSDLLRMMNVVKSEDDINNFLILLKKYSKQNASVQFSSYKFGPQVMRLFHLLNKPKEAMLFAEDPDFSNLCSPVSCKIVLFDLLYENQMYDDIIRLFKQDPTKHRASPLVILFFAACWKANTLESYKSAIEIHQFLQESNQNLSFMAKNYLALLCLEQNNPAAAFEILNHVMETTPVNIKVRAFAKAGRFKDLFNLLEKFVNLKRNTNKKCVITSDTINYISEEMNKVNLEGDDKTRWNNILQMLEENQLLDVKTLEENMCELMFSKLIYRKSEFSQDY